jgi:phosphohistidine phosphatase SixA
MRLAFKPLALVLILALACGCTLQSSTDSRAAAAPAASIVSLPADRPFINARALIIVRHANIDLNQKATLGYATPLLPEGQERAKSLIPTLKDAGITRIVTSPALRTQQTAAPVAAALHLTPEQGPGTAPELVAFLAQTAKPDQTILLVHHHSVMPSILSELGFKNETEAVDASEFDRVYLLLPNPAQCTYQLFRLRYGGKWD